MPWLSEPFASGRHEVSAFDSGEPRLDDWLRLHATGAEARRVARTFVWVPEKDPRVGGYYAISAHLIDREELSSGFAHGSPARIPAVLLAKLAVDARDQGQGVGSALLADALGRIDRATMTIAARFVIVDAVSDRAVEFYQGYGFRRLGASMRLALKVSAITTARGNGPS